MAVLNELNISGRAQREGYLESLGVSSAQANPLFDLAKDLLAKEFWKWYAVHYNDKVYTVRLWFITKTVRVSDLRPVFVMLFGDPQ